MNKLKFTVGVALSTLVLCCGVSCEKIEQHRPVPDSAPRDNALILFCAGFNNLSGSLSQNISSLLRGYVPSRDSSLLFIYSHMVEKGNYNIKTSPVLERVYRSERGTAVRDTLLIFPKGMTSADPELLSQMLRYLNEHFTVKNWGILFSGHGTAFLPAGFYDGEHSYSRYDDIQDIVFAPGKYNMLYGCVPDWVEKDPLVKTLSAEYGFSGDQRVTREMDVNQLRKCFPMHFKYIMMDSCLMGNMETAFALKDVCDYYGASPTEVLTTGFDYSKLSQYLLKYPEPDVKSVLEAYVDYYIRNHSSASISLVDCSLLDEFASMCRDIFAAHREALDNLDYNKVQRYYRRYVNTKGYFNPHWFFDVVSIVKNLGLEQDELADFFSLYDRVVVFRKSTASFSLTGGFDFKDFYGLSMYLPSYGDSALEKFYIENMPWQKATGLVNEK
ncbi:MAG: clostripain-related cysteine peptidase [Bacteroidales bacterium]|nr:clostripain-related cysteine peptidase [Bacteroidales bacterium]